MTIKRVIPYLKVLVHIVLLVPFAGLIWLYASGRLALYADPVNFLTHATGNWALWILLADLAITPVRRLHVRLGFLVRFRRLVGLYAFFYATLHLLTYVLLFSGFDIPAAVAGVRTGHAGVAWTQLKLVWPTMRDDMLKRRFIQVGLGAWVMLLALAVTSPAAVMRAMGGKRWQRLHRLIYVAAIAAVVHYLWLVKTGDRRPWPDAAVLIVLLGARLMYSLIQQRKRMKSQRRPVSAG